MTAVIVVVEDAEVCRDALELALAKIRGVELRMVTTAEDALHCLSQEAVCALVTDLWLPGMDGFGLIAAIRSRPASSTIPIVVISGDSDPRTPARVVDLGANAFFSKPYSPAEVRTKLEELLNAT